MISVVIIDDHPVVRAGLRAILDCASDIQVLAEGSLATDALRLVAELQPDVLVLDVNLPDGNGIDVTRQLCAQGAPSAILILTIHRDPQTIFGLLECGAGGYVLKDEALETLENAVRAVAQGETWLSPAVASLVVQRTFYRQPEPSQKKLPNEPHITPSELRVLCLLAKGYDNATIAQKLVVTKRTVQNHISNLYGKLGVKTRTQAMLYAIQHGLGKNTPDGQSSDEYSPQA